MISKLVTFQIFLNLGLRGGGVIKFAFFPEFGLRFSRSWSLSSFSKFVNEDWFKLAENEECGLFHWKYQIDFL